MRDEGNSSSWPVPLWGTSSLVSTRCQGISLPPPQGLEHCDQLFNAHSKVSTSSCRTLLLLMVGTESSWMMYL